MDLLSLAQVLGNIGEFVGAILLFASLIYVGIQVKQNTAATRAQVYQSRTGQAQAQLLFQAGSPDFADIINKVDLRDPETLTNLEPQEYTRYIAYELNLMTRMDNLYYQYSNGFLDQEYYEEVCEPIIREHAEIWKRLTMSMRAGFRKELERIVAEPAERVDRSRLTRKPDA